MNEGLHQIELSSTGTGLVGDQQGGLATTAQGPTPQVDELAAFADWPTFAVDELCTWAHARGQHNIVEIATIRMLLKLLATANNDNGDSGHDIPP